MGYLVLSPSPSPSPPHAFQHASSSSSGATACRRRARRGGAFVVASAASPLDGGPSPAAAAADAYVLARRVVLLGASAIPFVSLREAAAAPTPVDLVKVYGMSLSEGFVRRKWIDAPRVNHEAENCYETFKIGRNSIICRPKEDKIDETKNVPQFEGTKGIVKPENAQPEGTQSETTTPEARQRESSLQLMQEQPPENPLVGFLGTVGVAASGVLGGLYGTSLQEKKALQSIISSVNHLQTRS